MMTSENTGSVITAPLPDTAFYRPMRAGHLRRVGHQLVAHLASTDGGALWEVVRECCPPAAALPAAVERACYLTELATAR